MEKLDSLDVQLIELLQANARQSSEMIAKRLNTSPPTIRRRMRRLIKNGVIQIQAVVDPARVGLPLAAVIALDVEHDMLDSAMQTLTNLPEVRWVSTTTGRFDIIIQARFASTDDIFRFVQKEIAGIDGIRDSETFICLHLISKE